jgi:hypothetical protein
LTEAGASSFRWSGVSFSFAARALGIASWPKKAARRNARQKRASVGPRRNESRRKVKAARFSLERFSQERFRGFPRSASQRKLSAAVQSTQAVVIDSPPAALNLSATPPEVRIQPVSVQVDGIVMPSPVPITPTVYPDSPQGTIIVQNHVTITIQSERFGSKADIPGRQL